MASRTQDLRLLRIEQVVSQLIQENKDLRAQMAVLRLHVRAVRRAVEKK